MTIKGIRLAEEEQKIGALEAAQAQQVLADTQTRVWMSIAMSLLFIGLNAAVVWMVSAAATADIQLLTNKVIEPDQRLITENVFMTLIGATVVQVGAILVAITRYLFPAVQE